MVLLLIAAELTLAAGAGSHGEQRAEVTAKASSDDLSLTLAAGTFAGAEAPQRRELGLSLQTGVFKADLRAVPPAAGLQRASVEAGVHFETLGLVLNARTASIDRMRLDSAGARLELEGQLSDDVRGGFSASAWLVQLRSPDPSRAWLDWGMKTCDWPQRAELGGWLAIEFTEFLSLTPSLSVAQSAQPGVYEARFSLGLEVPVGPIHLRAEPGFARQFPELWLLDLTVGATLTL